MQTLTASDAVAYDQFGFSVEILGEHAFVGAIASEDKPGAVYVFARTGSTWTQMQKLTASDGAAGDHFGYLAVSDRNVMIGAFGADFGGVDSGRVYVFTLPDLPQTSRSSVTTVVGIVVALIATPSTLLSILYVFAKPLLRRMLLACGCHRVADFLVPPDTAKAIKALSRKVEEIEKFMAKQKLPRLRDITPEIASGDVKLQANAVLGIGGYGAVFRATYRDKDIAVKTMLADPAMRVPPELVENVRKEALIMCTLNHPNILHVFGVVPDLAWIVMEYCPRGSLQNGLLDPSLQLRKRDQLVFASQIATGVAYLHLPDVSIVHGDLKTANVLLANDGGIRLCDFGMSQAKNRSKTLTMASHAAGKGHTLTVAWSSPELFKDEHKSFASDVYALGVTVWEVFERRTPFGHMPEAAVVTQVISGERPTFRNTPIDVQSIIKLTWAAAPDLRISASQAAFALTRALEDAEKVNDAETPDDRV